jgi:putative membrane protein
MHHLEVNMRLLSWVVLGAVATLSVPALADTSDFLTKALKGDNSETRLGALAAARGQSRQVREFGAMLERDHSAARRQAAPLARRHHVQVTNAMADEAKAEYAKLQHLRGVAFDREFGRYMVEDHRKDIADFEKETRSGDPADVRRLAQQTLPTLRKHLSTASSIR